MREVGPADAMLTVRTFREGVAARAGHDLAIEVTRWSGRLGDEGTVELSADPCSLELREGHGGGIKPNRGLMGALKVRDDVESVSGL